MAEKVGTINTARRSFEFAGSCCEEICKGRRTFTIPTPFVLLVYSQRHHSLLKKVNSCSWKRSLECQRVITSSSRGLRVTWMQSSAPAHTMLGLSQGAPPQVWAQTERAMPWEKSLAPGAAELACQQHQPLLFREPACHREVLPSRIQVKLVGLRSATSQGHAHSFFVCPLHTWTLTVPLQSSCFQSWISVQIHNFTHFHLISNA